MTATAALRSFAVSGAVRSCSCVPQLVPRLLAHGHHASRAVIIDHQLMRQRHTRTLRPISKQLVQKCFPDCPRLLSRPLVKDQPQFV
jgi:hypothetical protein